MTQVKNIVDYITKIPKMELIFANELYEQIEKKFLVSEENFYKVLERLVRKTELVRLSKGVYTRPQKSRFGMLVPTESEIVKDFTKGESGMLVGYHLYNQLKLTTQVSKNYKVLTNNTHKKATIQNVSLKEHRLNFTESVRNHIAFLEVLVAVESIQDLNEHQFITYCKEFAIRQYDDEVLGDILKEIRYSKSTLYFLKLVLDSYQISNTVQKHLSKLSKYKKPGVKYYEVT